MELFGLLFLLIIGSLIIFGLYHEFRDAYHYEDTWGTIKYGLILSIIILVVIYGGFSSYSKHSIRSEFKPYISSYINIIPNQYGNSNLGFSPKIVIIDKNEQEIHNYHFKLPENQKALKHSEVDIIAWLNFSETFHTYYGTKKNQPKLKGILVIVQLQLLI